MIQKYGRWLRRVVNWLGDYWQFALLALVSPILVLFWATRKSGKTPASTLKTELAAIKAKQETRKVRLEHGAEQAKRLVNFKYARTRKNLDLKQRARVKSLEDNPEELAKVLERLTR